MRHTSIIVLLLCSVAAYSQEIRLSATTDSSSYRIGEYVVLRIEGEFPPEVTVMTPVVKDSLGPFEILKIETHGPVREEGLLRQSWDIRLIAFDTGMASIPPVMFDWMAPNKEIRRASSNPVVVTILGVIVDSNGDIKDIKPPLDSPWLFEDFLPYLLLLLVLAVAAVGYYFYSKKARRRKQLAEVIARTMPPHEIALAALRELEEKKLWQQGHIKEFYSEVTQIVRFFFEGRLGIVALEMTSDEILQQVKSVPEVEPLRKQVEQFLLTADLVKFAKYEPTPEEHRHELTCAYEIVRALIPRARVEHPKEHSNVRR